MNDPTKPAQLADEQSYRGFLIHFELPKSATKAEGKPQKNNSNQMLLSFLYPLLVQEVFLRFFDCFFTKEKGDVCPLCDAIQICSQFSFNLKSYLKSFETNVFR